MSRPHPNHVLPQLSQAPTPPRNARPLESTDVVLCVLCGAMNHHANAECWVCRWHGAFSRDGREISLAWQRLESIYEEVRLEHVTSRRQRSWVEFAASFRAKKGRGALVRLRRLVFGW